LDTSIGSRRKLSGPRDTPDISHSNKLTSIWECPLSLGFEGFEGYPRSKRRGRKRVPFIKRVSYHSRIDFRFPMYGGIADLT